MSIENQEDQALIREIRNGDKKSFRIVFDRYYESLLIVAIQLLKDRDAAKDAVQEVFFQIWKNRATFTISSSLAGYLKRGVINRALNQIKAAKPFEEEKKLDTTFSSTPSAQELLEAKDIQLAIQKGLDSLPERCRAVFVLRRMEGYSLKEIAEKLEISPKTVENQITKALKVLKQAVGPLMKKNTS